MSSATPCGEHLRLPGLLEKLFGYPAMQFRESDIPSRALLDPVSALENIDRELSDAATRVTPAPPAAKTSAPAAGLTLGKSEVIDLAIQTWRLSRRIENVDAEKLPRERKQLTDSLRRFQSLLKSLEIEVIDPVGQVYVDGWVEVEVVSWEAPDPGSDALVCRVKQTVAPIVRRAGEIIARGQIVATDTAT